SAVFRKGGDVTFLVEELKAVFDPRGGYFKAGGVYMPSIVAELGNIIEAHLKMIGLLHDPELSDAQRKLIADKRAAYEAATSKKKSEISTAGRWAGRWSRRPPSPPAPTNPLAPSVARRSRAESKRNPKSPATSRPARNSVASATRKRSSCWTAARRVSTADTASAGDAVVVAA